MDKITLEMVAHEEGVISELSLPETSDWIEKEENKGLLLMVMSLSEWLQQFDSTVLETQDFEGNITKGKEIH